MSFIGDHVPGTCVSQSRSISSWITVNILNMLALIMCTAFSATQPFVPHAVNEKLKSRNSKMYFQTKHLWEAIVIAKCVLAFVLWHFFANADIFGP